MSLPKKSRKNLGFNSKGQPNFVQLKSDTKFLKSKRSTRLENNIFIRGCIQCTALENTLYCKQELDSENGYPLFMFNHAMNIITSLLTPKFGLKFETCPAGKIKSNTVSLAQFDLM